MGYRIQSYALLYRPLKVNYSEEGDNEHRRHQREHFKLSLNLLNDLINPTLAMQNKKKGTINNLHK